MCAHPTPLVPIAQVRASAPARLCSRQNFYIRTYIMLPAYIAIYIFCHYTYRNTQDTQRYVQSITSSLFSTGQLDTGHIGRPSGGRNQVFVRRNPTALAPIGLLRALASARLMRFRQPPPPYAHITCFRPTWLYTCNCCQYIYRNAQDTQRYVQSLTPNPFSTGQLDTGHTGRLSAARSQVCVRRDPTALVPIRAAASARMC